MYTFFSKASHLSVCMALARWACLEYCTICWLLREGGDVEEGCDGLELHGRFCSWPSI